MDKQIKYEILKWHWAGKKHSSIIRLIKKKYNYEISRKDIHEAIDEYNENTKNIQPKPIFGGKKGE